jgi:hypothetical protein
MMTIIILIIVIITTVIVVGFHYERKSFTWCNKVNYHTYKIVTDFTSSLKKLDHFFHFVLLSYITATV